jgi:hypothetical protein
MAVPSVSSEDAAPRRAAPGPARRLQNSATPWGWVVPRGGRAPRPADPEEAASAGLSHRYGGVRFEHGDKDARAAGSSVGKNAWTTALTYFTGTGS